jgi:tryptophan synthase alpha chain
MKNRLLFRLQAVKRKKEKIFCAFLTLGYPSLKATEDLITGFEKLGVDVVELGFPFSDPLADGPTIQFSSQCALERGVHLKDAFKLAQKLRRRGNQIPLVFFTYLNPVLHYGVDRFVRQAKASGFDGLLVPDLPPEEEKKLQQACRRSGLAQPFLVALTTEKKRALRIAHKSQGFIYYVSLRGVTGARKVLPRELESHLRNFRRLSRKPFLVGFGVSEPKQAKALSRLSDGVIVGSALIDQLRKSRGKVAPVLGYVRRMIQAVKGLG